MSDHFWDSVPNHCLLPSGVEQLELLEILEAGSLRVSVGWQIEWTIAEIVAVFIDEETDRSRRIVGIERLLGLKF